jgi:C_GCAxxG_C_C family probable redox protein
MTNEEIESRAARAVDLFKQGFNCSQAVFTSCADLYGITDESLALRLAASFGGGMGRMRLVCGAASGMFMLAGLHNGSATPHDNTGKMENYAFVQQLAGDFKSRYGSLLCAELLGLVPKNTTPSLEGREGVGFSPKPADRTPEYYQKRPCSEMIAEAVRIYLRAINDK